MSGPLRVRARPRAWLTASSVASMATMVEATLEAVRAAQTANQAARKAPDTRTSLAGAA